MKVINNPFVTPKPAKLDKITNIVLPMEGTATANNNVK